MLRLSITLPVADLPELRSLVSIAGEVVEQDPGWCAVDAHVSDEQFPQLDRQWGRWIWSNLDRPCTVETVDGSPDAA